MGGGSLRSCVSQPVGDGPGFDDVAGEGEPVHDGGAEAEVGKGLGPAAEALVAGDRHRVGLLPLGENLEQQFSAATVELHVSQLVEAEQVDPPVAGYGLRQLLLIATNGHLADRNRYARSGVPGSLVGGSLDPLVVRRSR
jgi:hypothetical protein